MNTAVFKIIPQDPFDVQKAMEKHPGAKSWGELAAIMGLPERWHASPWAERAFDFISCHGHALARGVEFPDVHKVSDLFESVRLEKYNSNRTHDGYAAPYPNGGGCYIGGRGGQGVSPFFRPYAERYIKTRKNGEFFCHGLRGNTESLLTVAKLHEKFVPHVMGCRERETAFSFEAIRHDNGKILVTSHDGKFLSRPWLAYLDAGETPFSMLSDDEKKQYRDTQAREKAVRGCVADDGKTVDLAEAERLGVPIVADKY